MMGTVQAREIVSVMRNKLSMLMRTLIHVCINALLRSLKKWVFKSVCVSWKHHTPYGKRTFSNRTAAQVNLIVTSNINGQCMGCILGYSTFSKRLTVTIWILYYSVQITNKFFSNIRRTHPLSPARTIHEISLFRTNFLLKKIKRI